MRNLKLEFISPKTLNELKYGQMAEKSIWRYSGIPDSMLVIDTDSWIISNEDGSKSSQISNWCVNEETKELGIKTDELAAGFKDIDYVFALAMLGQLTDREGLIKYLASLKEIFDGIKPTKKNSDVDNHNTENN